MAFGDLRTNGTGSLTGLSIAASNVIPINGGTGVVFAKGDVFVGLVCEAGGPSMTGMTSSAGGAAVAQNAGTLSTVSGRMFALIVQSTGTVTSLTLTGTINSPGNDFSMVGAIFEGPFRQGQLFDKNPANTTGDITSPYTGPATTTLSYPLELVLGWAANNANVTDWVGASGFTTAVQAAQTTTHAVLGYQAVSTTASITPSFTSASSAPTANVMGTCSWFKAAETVRRVGRNQVLVGDHQNVWF